MGCLRFCSSCKPSTDCLCFGLFFTGVDAASSLGGRRSRDPAPGQHRRDNGSVGSTVQKGLLPPEKDAGPLAQGVCPVYSHRVCRHPPGPHVASVRLGVRERDSHGLGCWGAVSLVSDPGVSRLLPAPRRLWQADRSVAGGNGDPSHFWTLSRWISLWVPGRADSWLDIRES